MSSLPFDSWSVLAIIVATATLAMAAWIKMPFSARMALIVAAALIIRLDAAAQQSFHPWDERFHALVARNLVDHPLTPMLYARPALPYDYQDWAANHVWLHKPPFAMWLMAGSMTMFGRDELTMRLPSLALGATSVLLTGMIGTRLFGGPAGLLAAGFQSVNGFLVSLGSGRRVADHVDTVLILCIQAGVWCALAGRGRARVATTIGVGVALGAGILTKAWPALLVLPVAGVVWWGDGSPRRTITRVALAASIGALIAGPWILYTLAAFPIEARWSSAYILRHMTSTLEGQGGPWWSYLLDAPRFFGELVLIPLAWFLWRAVSPHGSIGGSTGHRALAVWIAVPYALFSLAATKMPGFVMIAAPAIFLVQAAFWMTLREYVRPMALQRRRVALQALLVLLTLLPARYLLEPTGPFERRDRAPAVIAALKTLDERLGPEDAVIFNVPQNIEAMFHSNFTVYNRLPRPGEAEGVLRAGRRVIVHQPPGTRVASQANGVMVADVLTP